MSTRVGTVYFDPSQHVSAGNTVIVDLSSCWASINGNQARRISSVHELPSDVIWLTNLSYSNFFRSGLHRHPNFRNDSWLRTSFYQLTHELGVDIESTDTATCVEVLSAVASRVAEYANKKYKVNLKSKTLNEDFAEAFGIGRSKIPDAYYDHFDSIAAHPSVSVIKNTNYSQSSPTVTVRRNRLKHARDVLATPVPQDALWNFEKAGANDNWLETVETPFLVNCSITNVKPIIGEILSWGAGSKNVRTWLTDIEWNIVRQYADVKVSSAIISQQPGKVLDVNLPSGKFSELSITEGIIAENVWTSFCKKMFYRGDISRFTAAAAWLRSADRMMMFDYAQKLYGRGLTVFSYGVGNVVLSYPENGLKRALDISTDVGLMPPSNKFLEATREV